MRMNSGNGTLEQRVTQGDKRLYFLGVWVVALLEMALNCSAWGYVDIGLYSASFIPCVVLMGAYVFGYGASAVFGLIFALGSTINATVNAAGTATNAMFSAFVSGKPVESLLLCFVPRLLFGLLGCWAYRSIRGKQHHRLWVILTTMWVDYVHAILVYVFSAALFPEIISWNMIPPLLLPNMSLLIQLMVPVALMILMEAVARSAVTQRMLAQIRDGLGELSNFRRFLKGGFLISALFLLLLLGIPLMFINNMSTIMPEAAMKAVHESIPLQWMNVQQLIGFASFTLAVAGLVAMGYSYYHSQETKAREKIEAEMEKTAQALKEARYASQAKSQFLSNMSHDIRTPMNAIVGYTAIASTHVEDKVKVGDCLSKIAHASDHLQGLINDVLDMSRIEAGKEEIHLSKTSLPEMVRAVVPMIQSQLERKNLELFIDTFDLKNEWVYADTQKMRQILINILGNAVKFTENGGSVGVRIRQQKVSRVPGYGSYLITIKDTGIGMSPEFVDKVFEPFSQAKSEEQGRYTGTGLGMAITKSFVDMMGGTITVKSELGKGTEFAVSLDLKLQEDQKPDERLEQLKGFRILVVDDDFETCNSVSHMLQDVGMRADWSTSAKDALQRAEVAFNDGDSFFGYIIDWVMPGTNGIELTRKIRRIVGDEVPIVILTAYSWADVEEEAKAAGVTALCTKPLFVSDLTRVFLENISDVSSEKKKEAEAAEVHFDGQRVLLAEDNKMNREIATIQLEEMGLQVTSVVDGQQAVNAMMGARDGYYDYILMDIRMPNLGGIEATRAIRASNRPYLKQIPIIALTANAFNDDAEACLAAGMNEHVAKPFDAEQLGLVLKKYQK